jgi:hypothetical protein
LQQGPAGNYPAACAVHPHMAILFYLAFVFFSKEVTFSLGWFFIALLFSGNEAKTVYRYTTNPALDGKPAGACGKV